jgi:peptide deformylase
LAAPQIGISRRVAVVDVSKKEKKHGAFVMINPILLHGEGLQIPREGCLSVPDLLANVRRYQTVSIRFQDDTGSECFLKTDGFEALAVQHEIDHLDGKLFLDRVANLKTDVFRRRI